MNFASQRLLFLPPPPAFLFREKLSGKERTVVVMRMPRNIEREQRFTNAFFLVVPDKITHPRDGIQKAQEQKEAGYEGKKGTLWREEMPMKSERKTEERLLTSTISPD